MESILLFIWESRWSVIGILILIFYGKKLYQELIFTPLAGGNGKVQMDEMAKAIILAVFMYSCWVEAHRKTEAHVFSDAYYFSLLLTVCAIAAIKPLFANMDILRGKKTTNDEPPKP